MTTFVTGVNGTAGVPMAVSFYDPNGVLIPASQVVWTGLPVDGSISLNQTGPSTMFLSNKIQTVLGATATAGLVIGTLTLVFAAEAGKFSSP